MVGSNSSFLKTLATAMAMFSSPTPVSSRPTFFLNNYSHNPPRTQTVYFLRHAQGVHQIGNRKADPELTEKGVSQAKAWAADPATITHRHHSDHHKRKRTLNASTASLNDPNVVVLKPEVVLISPLQRTMETALWALENADPKIPLFLTANAREKSWGTPCNILGPRSECEGRLKTLPRGEEILDHSWARSDQWGSVEWTYEHMPAHEPRGYFQKLLEEIAARPEKVVLVVTHSLFMNSELGGKWPANAEIMEAEFDGHSVVVKDRYLGPGPWSA